MTESTLVYSTEVGRIKAQKQPYNALKVMEWFAYKNKPVVEKAQASQ